MKNFEESLAWLESVSVRFRPKLAETYEKALDITESFDRLSDAEKTLVVSCISDGVSRKLLSFSSLFAECAMAERESRWIRGAIILHVMEDFRWDYRENFRRLILIFYAAQQIGVNFAEVVRDVLSSTSTRTREYLEGFLERDPSLNELSGFGMKVELVDGRPRFVQVDSH